MHFTFAEHLHIVPPASGSTKDLNLKPFRANVVSAKTKAATSGTVNGTRVHWHFQFSQF